MRRILWIVAAATTALWACGGSESAGGTTSTVTSGATTTTGAGGTGSGGGDGGIGGNGKVCTAGNLCLQVKPIDPANAIPSGRLAIAWYAFDDTNTTPPLIAYDVAFDPATTRIDVPYEALVPVPEALMLCARSCMDPAKCPCVGDPALGFAVVSVGQDQNKDGKLDWTELEATRYGAGQLALVYSQKAYHPSPASVASVLPEGINVGTHGYRIIAKSDGSPFDQLGIAFDGTVFDLAVCSAAPGCKVPTPNLH